MASPSSFQRRHGRRFAGPGPRQRKNEGVIDSSADLSAELRCEGSREGLDRGANATGTRGHAIARGPRPDSAERAEEVGFAVQGHGVCVQGRGSHRSSGPRVEAMSTSLRVARRPRRCAAFDAVCLVGREPARGKRAALPRVPTRNTLNATLAGPRFAARRMRRSPPPSFSSIPSARSLAMRAFTPPLGWPRRVPRATWLALATVALAGLLWRTGRSGNGPTTTPSPTIAPGSACRMRPTC